MRCGGSVLDGVNGKRACIELRVNHRVGVGDGKMGYIMYLRADYTRKILRSERMC